VPEIMYRGDPGVFFGKSPYDLNCVGATLKKSFNFNNATGNDCLQVLLNVLLLFEIRRP
jgi:hypothetical protein